MAILASTSPVLLHSYSYRPRQQTELSTQSMAVKRTKGQISTRSGATLDYTRRSDSSDDEDLAPIKLSAEAQAILGEEQAQAERENIELRRKDIEASLHEALRQHRNRSPQLHDGSPAPRVQRPSPPMVLERDGSFAYKIHDKSKTFGSLSSDSRTPAPRLRKIRVSGQRTQAKSPPSAGGAVQENEIQVYEDEGSHSELERPSSANNEEGGQEPHTIARPRKEAGSHSTARTHKIGTGTLLRGAVRRGMVRRQSEDEESHLASKESDSVSPEIQRGRKADAELDNQPDDLLFSYDSPPIKRGGSPQESVLHTKTNESSDVLNAPMRPASPVKPIAFAASTGRQHPTPASDNAMSSSRSSSSRRPVFKIPSLPPLESVEDQENEPPPTFKRVKPALSQLERHEDQDVDKKEKIQAHDLMSRHSPPRQPLVARSNNTPHRPAPLPPPKMSLVEAATSNAGNSRAKKSVHYVLNGRPFRRLDCIGKGGSSRVFRIMAENYKIFALKRVNLEEADEAAIAGYKGEIELLKKLENVDRAIRLFDYEVNHEKGVLSILMELGETDFNKMLNDHLKNETSKFDITFTRHYWKEMLECVQAVHEHDIVHSDLKPANFLLVKGQLKLIDFGIANAIQDNTVNVHRENQIGTPNYMSPESLVHHKPMPGQPFSSRILKLGKPSDVWSLGCILYQMTYGQPPFAHITKPMDRIYAIPNPEVEIEFPATGIGRSVVPFGLIKTLRRCLQRDQTLRPTIKELLSDADPFLNPVAISPDMLGRVIGNVVSYCRKREESYRQSGQLGQAGISCLPRDEDMRGWPQAFYEKLRQAQEDGTAW